MDADARFEITAWIEDRTTGRVVDDDAALLQALHSDGRRRVAALLNYI